LHRFVYSVQGSTSLSIPFHHSSITFLLLLLFY
jgi:hypothetical protein